MGEVIEVELPGGHTILARVDSSGPRDVADRRPQTLDLDRIKAMVRGIGLTFKEALNDLSPDHVGIEFGIEFAIRNGVLTSVLAQAQAASSVRVSASWSK